MTRGRKLYTSPERKVAYWKKKTAWFNYRDRQRSLRRELRKRSVEL